MTYKQLHYLLFRRFDTSSLAQVLVMYVHVYIFMYEF